MRILVTGGVRSGKSTHAEALIGHEPATYVAAGPTPDAEADPDWTARIAAHRARRPDSWTTVETQDIAEAIRRAEVPVLVDCLGTWLTAADRHGGRVGAGRRHRPPPRARPGRRGRRRPGRSATTTWSW